MWRSARISDDAAVASLGSALYTEDPSPDGVSQASFGLTLAMFRKEPWRGQAWVLEIDGAIAGYAFLVSFWSNELGGEVCVIDELYVAPVARSRGFATRLIIALTSGSALWPREAVAVALAVTPANLRARALYERLGFTVTGLNLIRRCDSRPR